jgi:predicted glycosyltransferase
MKAILFISGSLGLGHIGRDLAIVNKLRELNPDVQVSWLADYPATLVLEQAGEKLLPEAKMVTHGNKELDSHSGNHGANLTRWVMNMRKNWSKNAKIVLDLIKKSNYDLVIGDETYDLAIEFLKDPSLKSFPFVIIFDFLGLDRVTDSPVDALVTYYTNRIWVRTITHDPSFYEKILFVGELEDIADKRFGLFLPNRREIAKRYFDFVGYVFPFNPKDYSDIVKVRRELGYGSKPLGVCSIGGTSAGRDLLDLCLKALPLIREQIEGFEMVLVCGPEASIDGEDVEGARIVGYLPELYKHLAACDVAVVTGGGTVTLELTALNKPFLYFPLEDHFEQEVAVSGRCERHGAGVRMRFSKTTPELLAKEVVSIFGKKVSYDNIPVDGAKKSADLINELLNSLGS